MSINKPLASEIYALSQGCRCEGAWECHYCGGRCSQALTHNEPMGLFTGKPLTEGVRKRPGSPFLCVGCWLWKRKKLTASFLSGGYKDGTSPCDNSWIVTPSGAWAITTECGPRLYKRLLGPTQPFFLMVREGTSAPAGLIQSCPGNEPDAENPDKTYQFTVNNVIHSYSIVELQQSVLTGDQGREPGVRALIRIFGPVPRELVKLPELEEAEENRGRGRPTKQYPTAVEVRKQGKGHKWRG